MSAFLVVNLSELLQTTPRLNAKVNVLMYEFSHARLEKYISLVCVATCHRIRYHVCALCVTTSLY